MQSVIYLVSPSTKQYCDPKANYFEVKGQLNEAIYRKLPDERFDVVFGIGGGSVIDAAKIIAKDSICIAIPTTASGSAMTSHSVVWGIEKINIKTRIPILWEMFRHYPIRLRPDVYMQTRADCLCHILDSEESDNATKESLFYCGMARASLNDFNSIYSLIDAGNWAGRAIEITGTGRRHKESYPLTLEKGLSHGAACMEILKKEGL